VLNSGRGQTVFVALGDGKFEPRMIKVGLQSEDGYVQVLMGLAVGDRVVTSAQFMLDSESKLREAIQKMMEPKSPEPTAPASSGKDKGQDDLFESKPSKEKEDLESLFK
jgi:Cu(I)/Ag(I) efflux system membrane fusion protein/cobalt-zinc-cadmium efflux system membrane fusion protein